MTDNRRTPPLGSLRVFVAAAQTESVTGAAEKLHLTHGAVSHQLRQLQDHLGVALFERRGRGLKLTTQGAAYAEEVSRAPTAIGAATERLSAARDYRRLRISCMPSFAARWLLPRLAGFIASHRDLDVEVQSNARLADSRLVRPFAMAVESPISYFFVCRPADEQHPAVAAFREWLFREAAAYRRPQGDLGPPPGSA